MSRPFHFLTVSGLTFAGLGMVAVAGLWQNARLLHERHVLQADLALLRGESSPKAPDEEVEGAPQIVKLAGAIAEETALLHTAEAKLTALQKTVPSVEGEELHSFGRIEQMGREAADFLPLIAQFGRKSKDPTADKLSDEEWSSLGAKLLPWLNRLAAVGELEDNPADIACFHAASLQARLQLDAATTDKVRGQIAQEFEQIKRQGLVRGQRPENTQGEWYRRRKQALDDAAMRIDALIPAAQREPYAVGQSLHLGTGLRTNSTIGADGHGSISMGLDLPGIEMNH